eukprot:CAMPEP_0204037670 /NCGR_PEP_ID=MMETSP0360-20130528/84169_1 /ASSEMBLY_ACC=CAM_ASM_000342 /TAXON_ID=268821 /ORGANISM="Scrippsiella Hangoei, Strain SHTV-5" /LENGTH=43 /DNA_ID= /DNA_START= /DNA_END= /DNA_ORIENTATION=
MACPGPSCRKSSEGFHQKFKDKVSGSSDSTACHQWLGAQSTSP